MFSCCSEPASHPKKVNFCGTCFGPAMRPQFLGQECETLMKISICGCVSQKLGTQCVPGFGATTMGISGNPVMVVSSIFRQPSTVARQDQQIVSKRKCI